MERQEISIREAGPADAETIHRLAHETWWPTYQDFLPHGQIETMLQKMYSIESLLTQMQTGCRFFLLCRDRDPLGFAGIRIVPADTAPREETTTLVATISGTQLLRIDKLYIHPAAQGLGGGAGLLAEICQQAQGLGINLIELHVNRYNPAVGFYQKQGFSIYQEIDIPYDRFVLNDYIMRKTLAPV